MALHTQSSGGETVKDEQFSFTITTDGDWDSEVIPVFQCPETEDILLSKVVASVIGSSTPSLLFNLEERAYGSLNSSGVDVFSSDQSADADSIEITSFVNQRASALSSLVFTTPTSAETGTVSLIHVTCYFSRVAMQTTTTTTTTTITT